MNEFSFLNHQMDINLLDQMGAEFERRFARLNLSHINVRIMSLWRRNF